MDQKHEIKEAHSINQYVRPELDFCKKYIIYMIIGLVLLGILLTKPELLTNLELFTYLTAEPISIITESIVIAITMLIFIL